MPNWVEQRIDWRKKRAPFSRLRRYDAQRLLPVMECAWTPSREWHRLRELWLELPSHPALLEAVSVDGDAILLLRYAAIDWEPPTFASLTDDAVWSVARWGMQLADLFDSLHGGELGRFADPFGQVDIAGRVRVGFRPVGGWTQAMAPEAKRAWPRYDEAACVYTVGKLTNHLMGALTYPPLRAIVDRCCHKKAAQRYKNLDEVGRAFQAYIEPACHHDPLGTTQLRVWRSIEESIGWKLLGEDKRPLDPADVEGFLYFERKRPPTPGDVMRIRELSTRAIFGLPNVVPTRQWTDAEPEALRLEAARDFAGALGIYRSVIVDDTNRALVYAARARAHLEYGEPGIAIDYARRALAADASNAAARLVVAKALLAHHQHQEALVAAEQLSATEPALSQYLRGKALLALSRLDEARDAFDRACTLDPTLLEAMMLRREVDRTLSTERKRVGSQGPIEVELPASLDQLRNVLLAGDTEHVIATLGDPRYADDPDAQLLLARMLVLERELDRAAAIYDRLALLPDPHRHVALRGKAGILFERGSFESALALFDLLCAEKPTDADASEGRARTLERLGRLGEAAAEYRRFVALARSRSDLRVRAAQLWLEQQQ